MKDIVNTAIDNIEIGNANVHKPENFTHLYGNNLTEKNNPVIIFRGKLDTLCAAIMEAQLLGKEKESNDFVNDLQEILEFVHSLFLVEYKLEPLETLTILGYTESDLRQRSHYPKKYYGKGHLTMHYSMGDLCLRLNSLRTLTRETELAAVNALNAMPYHKSMQSIVQALNRLSSLFYILIYKYLD